jgi:hypothetical protein
MAVTANYRTSANSTTEGTQARDVSDIIFHTGEPTEAPLVTLTGGKLYKSGGQEPEDVKGVVAREACDNVKYEVIEKDPLARTVVTNGAIASTTTATLVVDSSANIRVGDTIFNKTSGEVCYVTAIDANGTDVTVRRNLGSSSFAIADNSVWTIMGNAFKQGGSKATLKSQLAAARERYVQITKRSFGVTDTAMNLMLETKQVDLWDEEATQALVEHKKDIEYMFWMNPQADSTTDSGSNTVYLTRGIIGELVAAGNFTDVGGGLTEDEFFGPIAEKIFEFGPARKSLFVDARFKSIINQWERAKVMSKNRETKSGLNIQELETGHGILEIVLCGVFGKFYGDTKKGFGVALDLERLAYKYVKNRDTKIDENIHTPGDDVKESQYITEAGPSLRSLAHHRVIYNAA